MLAIAPIASQLQSPHHAFERPTSLLNALAFLPLGYVPIAGGTDYYPARVAKPLTDSLLDLSAITSLKGFTTTETLPSASGQNCSALTIGALTTWRQCVQVKQNMPDFFTALAQAAKDVGGWQIQNRATLGGNLCNASPAADGTVALLGLNASVKLARIKKGAVSYRDLALTEFVLGSRKTALAADELLVSIQIPSYGSTAKSVFLKLGHRKYLVISIVMVAVLIDFDGGDHVSLIHVAIGSCTKAAVRISSLEKVLMGVTRAQVMSVLAKNLNLIADAIAPIDDVRGTATYRIDAAQVLVQRALSILLNTGASS
jgi:CO/xanthine dehydrogenase FAD-binding subunit